MLNIHFQMVNVIPILENELKFLSLTLTNTYFRFLL